MKRLLKVFKLNFLELMVALLLHLLHNLHSHRQRIIHHRIPVLLFIQVKVDILVMDLVDSMIIQREIILTEIQEGLQVEENHLHKQVDGLKIHQPVTVMANEVVVDADVADIQIEAVVDIKTVMVAADRYPKANGVRANNYHYCPIILSPILLLPHFLYL